MTPSRVMIIPTRVTARRCTPLRAVCSESHCPAEPPAEPLPALRISTHNIDLRPAPPLSLPPLSPLPSVSLSIAPSFSLTSPADAHTPAPLGDGRREGAGKEGEGGRVRQSRDAPRTKSRVSLWVWKRRVRGPGMHLPALEP